MSNKRDLPETFDGDWLSLREAVDHQSRNPGLTAAAADWLASRAGGHLLDMGTGSGSNVRYLASRLAGPQCWQLLDHDAGLLAEAERSCSDLRDAGGRPVSIATRVTNLVNTDELASGDEPAHLVSASALLDLVSEPWLNRLAEFCQAQGAAVLVVLSYDGTVAFDHKLELDGLVLDLVNAHQRGPKGFGAALGPDAAGIFEGVLRSRGFAVSSAASPWELDGRHSALQSALIQGWSDAASHQAPEHSDIIETWRSLRLAEAAAGNARIRVGHKDIFAVPVGS